MRGIFFSWAKQDGWPPLAWASGLLHVGDKAIVFSESWGAPFPKEEVLVVESTGLGAACEFRFAPSWERA